MTPDEEREMLRRMALCFRCRKRKARWLTGHGRLCTRCRNWLVWLSRGRQA